MGSASAWAPVNEAPPAANGWTAVDETPKAVESKGLIAGTASTMADQAKRAFGAAWEYLNPKTLSAPLFDPEGAAKQAFQYTADAIGRVQEAASKGDKEGVAFGLLGSIPLAGPAAEQIAREIHDGKFSEAIGHAGALVALHQAPKIVEGGVDAGTSVVNSASDVSSFVKKAASVTGTVAKDYATDPAIQESALRFASPRAAAAVDLGKATLARAATLRDKIATASARYDRSQPLPPSDRVPIWQQEGSAPPADIPEAPPDRTVAPQPRPGTAPAAPPSSAAARVPVWQPITQAEESAAGAPAPAPAPPARLPSGRIPGKPAFDTTSGEMVAGGASEGHFELPARANPAQAAFDAAKAAQRPPEPPPEAAPPGSTAPTPPPPAAPAAPASAAPPAGAIPAPAQLPPKLITEKQLGQWAADNGLPINEAEAQLVADHNTRVINRVTLNRTLHAIAGDHETLSGIAKNTFGVDSMKKLSDEQMLDLVARLSTEEAAPEPDLTEQLQQSLAQARARRAPGAKNVGAPMHPGKTAFEAARSK